MPIKQMVLLSGFKKKSILRNSGDTEYSRDMAAFAVVLFVIFRPRQKYNPVPAVIKITMYLTRHLYRIKNYSNVIQKPDNANSTSYITDTR
jgi:hypothetical protein